MVLRPEVIKAFETLGVSADADETTASRAYKRLALLHHPDRNHGDQTSTARFQEIGAAWDICTRHYENPRWSEAPQPGSTFCSRHGGPGMYYDDDDGGDDDDFMDEEERYEFFRYMFFEAFVGGYTRSKGQRFRSERHGRHPSSSSYGYGYPSFSSTSFYPSSYSADSTVLQEAHAERQRKEKEKYEKRMREFELEMEAEQREIERQEREKQLKAEQRISAQAEAFEFARAGNSLGVRNAVDKYSLDVNAPAKQQKKPQTANFQTLLHLAGSSCDPELVFFLLDRGADITALNKENLTPFHQSILSGNAPVVRFFLSRRAKSSDGCHPSKAAVDGRTPLQLAIASNSVPTVELLLKDATVHDVERCWGQPSLPVAIRDILETKKGFVPPSTPTNGPPMSRKAQLKAEAARKLATEKEEKQKRLAEERARAAENQRRKEERAARRAEEERLKEESRRKLEEEEHQKAQEARRIEEQERERAELEACKRAEAEALVRREEAVRSRAEEEQRKKLALQELRIAEAEARRRAEEEVQRKAEQEGRRRIEQEERRKVLEMEARQRLEVEMRQRELVRRMETEHREVARQREVEERQKEQARAEQQAQVRERQAQIQQQRRITANGRKQPRDDPAAKHAENMRRLQAQAEEHERLKLQRQGVAVQSICSSTPEVVTSDKAEIMRRRAEQSARDKARNQRIKEEKAAMERAKQGAQTALDSLTVNPKPADAPIVGVSDSKYEAIMRKRAEQSARDKARNQRIREEKSRLENEKRAAADHRPYLLTPSLTPPPLSWSAQTPSHTSNTAHHAPLSPPMTPEDLQTCAIPDDLFVYEKPQPHIVNELYSSASPSPSSTRGGDQGPARGRGRGHGRGPGGYVPGSTDAEKELIEKNLEIQRLSAQLEELRRAAVI